mgnify:FL=1
MAQKRMFSLNVVDTDNFLDMPVSARLLYYELGMRADDDGFVDNWKKILLFTGLKNDDLKILIAKNFIIPFETGVIVIRHWRMNNYLQNDRVKPTTHQQELKSLELDENNVYNKDTTCIQETDIEDAKLLENTGTSKVDTDCIHSIDKNSINENSIDEGSIDEGSINNNQNLLIPTSFSKKEVEKQLNKEFDKLWEYYPNKKGKDQAKNKYISARKNGTTYEEVAQGLKNYLNYIKSENIEPKFIKHGSTWFNQKSWNDDYKITSYPNKKSDEQWALLKGVYDGTIKINK